MQKAIVIFYLTLPDLEASGFPASGPPCRGFPYSYRNKEAWRRFWNQCSYTDLPHPDANTGPDDKVWQEASSMLGLACTLGWREHCQEGATAPARPGHPKYPDRLFCSLFHDLEAQTNATHAEGLRSALAARDKSKWPVPACLPMDKKAQPWWFIPTVIGSALVLYGGVLRVRKCVRNRAENTGARQRAGAGVRGREEAEQPPVAMPLTPERAREAGEAGVPVARLVSPAAGAGVPVARLVSPAAGAVVVAIAEVAIAEVAIAEAAEADGIPVALPVDQGRAINQYR